MMSDGVDPQTLKLLARVKTVGRTVSSGDGAECAHRGSLRRIEDARPETKPRAGGGFLVTAIDFPNRPRYRTAPPYRITRYPRRHPGHRLGRRRDGLLRGAGQRCSGQSDRRGAVWADQHRHPDDVTMPDRG